MLEGADITSYNLLKRAHTEAIYYYGESNIKPLLDAMFTQEE